MLGNPGDETWGLGRPPKSAAPSAPAAAPPPPSGGGSSGGGGGGYSPPPPPNWQDLLANNPYYLAAQALAKQQLAALKAQTGAAAARALVNLGDYGLAGAVHGLDIPSNTSALVDQANQAGTSVLSQYLYQHGLNERQIPARLAGRGFYRSGETGYELGQENRQYGLRQGQARQTTLDYLNGLYESYLSGSTGIQQNELNAYLQAYQQAMAQIAGYAAPGGPSPSAGPIASSGSYIDTAKRLLNQTPSLVGGGRSATGF